MQPNFDGHQPSFFEEIDIIALQELDANERYVPIERLCRTLGLDPAEEAQFIQAHGVLRQGARVFGNDGLGLPADLVPLWLLTLDSAHVDPALQSQLALYQRECASVLWQAFKPQGFGPSDTLVPDRADMTPADHAYQGMMAQAALARQQMMIERQLELDRSGGNRRSLPDRGEHRGAAFDLARAVRRVAHGMAERSRRNEYGGVFSGLYRQFGISSYRNVPVGRLHEALDWLERWHGDILGEPEPPPDI